METIHGLISVQAERVEKLGDLVQEARENGETFNAEYWQGARDEALDMLHKFEQLEQSITERRTK